MSAYKPKIYRSQEGCCICKAKSSSSRFTDSGKYEDDCTDCFKLAENRRGEICNACVLIVKRWKKLPRNTGKNWAHVVDARTGPGTKNIFKQKKKESPVPFEKPYKYKHVYKRKPLKTKKREEEEVHQVLGHMSSTRPAWSSTYCSTPEFLDNSYWRRQTMCCGVVYLGRLGEAMLDQRLYQPCTKSGKHDLTLSPTAPLAEHPGSLQPSPSSSTSVQPASPSSSSSAFSSSLTPSSIESLVEAELQAFQSMETMEAEEDEEFYMDASKVMKKRELSELSSMQPDDGDEGFCDRLDQKSEQFRSSLSLITIH